MVDNLPTLSEEAISQRIHQEMLTREPHDLLYPFPVIALVTVDLTVPARGFGI